MRKHKSNIDFSQINKDIFVGTNACCQIHFDSSLIRKGVGADLSLEKERIDQPWGIDYFLWLPTKDEKAPTQKQFNIGVAFINSLIANKIKIYVHCKNGHGRAPAMAAAYFISKGMSVDEAIKTIAKKRPEIHINSVQKKALQKYYDRI